MIPNLAPVSDLARIVEQFAIEGRYLGAERVPSGHINDTYAATFRTLDGTRRRYLLQRINHHVFHHPAKLMENIEGVTTHLRKKIEAGGGDPDREAMTLVPTRAGGPLLHTTGGEYWRTAVYIEGARTYQVPESPTHIYHAGRAFGRFQSHVSDYPAQRLHETIPDFHHTPRRFAALVQAVEDDIANRAASVRDEIAFVEQRAGHLSLLVDLLARGRLPLRVTHNDTKFDNVLIDDDTGRGLCVIDLDTVMPGLAVYDFGDAVRAGTNTATEDEPNLDKVGVDLVAYEQLARGYLSVAGTFLTSLEVEYLAFSAWLITLETGMRFLADYVNGDIYFRTHRPDHNLDRCRTQFKMVRDMELKMDHMATTVARYAPP